MCRKLIFLISFVLAAVLVNSALAATWTDGDPNDHLWSTPGNWDTGTVPLETGEGEGVRLEYLGPGKEGPLINEGTTANANRLRGPGYEILPGSDLTMTGGTLTFNKYWRVGYGGAAGIVNMSGGTVINNCNYSIYMNAGSVFNLSGGTVNAGFYIPSGYSYGPDVSTLNMTGGIIDGNAPPNDSGWIQISTEGKGPGLVNLHGGTIITPGLAMDVNGLMDITEGTMIIDGDVEATITEYVGNGWLTAYGGAGTIVCSYDDVNDVTFVTALSSTPFAYGPSPADRAEDVSPDVVLKWTPGDWAADVNGHEVYFGTDFNDVNDANKSSPEYKGAQNVDANYYDPLGPDLLEWNTTYYWRIDEVNDACDPNGWRGRAWTFTVHDGKASSPSPADGAWRVPGGTYLLWTEGPLDCDHDVYLGTDYNSVRDANKFSPEYKTTNTLYLDTGYDPVALEPATRYYWRIDEDYSAAEFVKGDVWSFSTVGLGETLLLCDISEGEFTLKEGWTLISDANAQSSGAGLTWPDVNGTGIDVTIDTGVGDDPAFRTRLGEPLGMDYVFADDESGSPDADIIVSLGNLIPGDYILTTFHNNTAGEPKDINDVIISGGVTYSRVITSLPAPQTRSAVDNALGSIEVEFTPTGSDDVIIRYMASSDGSVFLNGFILDFFPPDTRFAYWPNPRDFAQDVDPGVVLSWWPGDYAADTNAHEVYFGTSWDDVNDANNSLPIGTSVYKGPQDRDANTYDPGYILDLGTTYYWRVDEVNDACDPNGWRGNLWRFTVAEYIIIDDFEKYDVGYADEQPGSWEITPDTGSTIEFGDSGWGPVHGGEMSMIYWYDNTWDWGPGYYSEASTEALSPTDWASSGLKVLTLWFYGDPLNDAGDTEQMYVGLKDTSDLYAYVDYGAGDEDMSDIQIEDWQEWNIALSSFTDVNLADVEKLYIGFGISGGDEVGGEGTVYFDDIRLYPPVCRPEKRPAEFAELDLNDDCIIDFGDVEIMAEDWLEADVNLGSVTQPSDANLVGWWKLDEGDGNVAVDSSIYDHNGVIETNDVNVYWVAGRGDVNYALDFDGGRVRVADAPLLRPTKKLTVCAWIQYSEEQEGGARIVCKGANDEETFSLEVGDEDYATFLVRDSNDPDDNKYDVNSVDRLDRGDWIHLAGTYDNNSVKFYLNGELKDTLDDPNAWGITLSQDTNDLAIGKQSDEDENEFEGIIDEVRLYDHVLSAEEIAWLASDGTGIFSVQSVANLYNDEVLGKRAVNFRDFAKLAKGWLDVKLWPE